MDHSPLLDINVTTELSLYQHLINMNCILTCADLNYHTTLQINAGGYLKIQIMYANLLLVFTMSIFFDSHTLNLLELQYNFAVCGTQLLMLLYV